MADEYDDKTFAVYFKCLRGTNEHFALTEPNSFAFQDEIGKNWICYPIPPHVVKGLDLLSDLAEIGRADQKSGGDTDLRLVFCQNLNELSKKLV